LNFTVFTLPVVVALSVVALSVVALSVVALSIPALSVLALAILWLGERAGEYKRASGDCCNPLASRSMVTSHLSLTSVDSICTSAPSGSFAQRTPELDYRGRLTSG